MEPCPVCMENVPNCKLVCGHSYCRSCVKEWYYKCEDPTCPMCRHPLYFKGMYKTVDLWDQEKHEKQIQEVFSESFDVICEEFSGEDFEFDFDEDDIMTPQELMLDEIIEMENKFRKFMLCGDEWNPEVLFEVLNDPFCEPSIETDHYAYEKPPKKSVSANQPYRKLIPREAKRNRETIHDPTEIIYVINIYPL